MVKIGPLEITIETYDGEEVTRRHKELPQQGRCADRIEDFFTVLSGGWNNSWEQHKQVLSTMIECLRSEPGDEPRDRYVQLTRDHQYWQDHAARPSRVERLRAMEQQQPQQQQTQQSPQQQQQQQLGRQQHQTVQRQQGQQHPSGQPAQQQQQQHAADGGFGWLSWWRRNPQPLSTAEPATAE